MEFRQVKLLGSLLLVACLTGFASDIYTPSFTQMTQDLNVSIPTIQNTLVVYMLGVSVSQLIYGTISEIIGRRKPLLIGLMIMLIGSLTCIYAPNIDILLIGRFIQGSGAGACAGLWRSIFRDSFDTTQISRYGGYLGIFMIFIIATSPALGGYLGWRASFIAVTIYTFITLLLVWLLLNETSSSYDKDRLNIYFFTSAFGQLLTSPIFMGYALCVFLTYGAFFSWIILGSIIMTDNLGITAHEFGLINFFLGGISMMLASFFNGKMIVRLGSSSMLRLGWGLMLLSGLMFSLFNYIYGQTLVTIVFSVFIFLFGSTLIWPNSFAGAFAPFGSIAGCAGALYSFIQLGGGVIFGWLSSFLSANNTYSLPMIFIISSTLAWLVFEFVVMKKVKLNMLNKV